MAEPAYGTATRTEISERTSELVLPSVTASERPIPIDAPERKADLSDPAAPSSRSSAARSASSRATRNPALGDTQVSRPQSTQETQRGVALPGDRGPRAQTTQTQRPSFWRRIALGGRKTDEVDLAPARETAANTSAVEQRIVEPLLQALVSVEAKLERSHVDLTKRSDQVEQRLTQLWDIEEQLGTLVEIQESLLHVSEQQRRLASAVESQTRTLRWLVGSVFVSLATAAFVIAAML